MSPRLILTAGNTGEFSSVIVIAINDKAGWISSSAKNAQSRELFLVNKLDLDELLAKLVMESWANVGLLVEVVRSS